MDETEFGVDDSERWVKYHATRLLSEFAANLHVICQEQTVSFFPPFLRKGFHVDAVELADGGLNLTLHGHGLFFIEMEKIGGNSFYRKHGEAPWVIPPWIARPEVSNPDTDVGEG